MTDWASLLAHAFDKSPQGSGNTGNVGNALAIPLTDDVNFYLSKVTSGPQDRVAMVTRSEAGTDRVTHVTSRMKTGNSATAEISVTEQVHGRGVTNVTAVTTQREVADHDAFHQLRLMSLPDSFGQQFFGQLAADCEAFFARWSGTETLTSWSDAELLGVHPRAPTARYDALGLLLLVRGGEVVELEKDQATIRSKGGARLIYRKRASAEAIPIWKLAN
jgi:hypothetical protein